MVLHITSLVLATNAIHALLKNYMAYGMAFLALTITSLVIHTGSKSDTFYDQSIFWIDQIAVYTVAFVGFYYFLQVSLLQKICAIISIILVIFYYGYGYMTTQFIWDPQCSILYHASMHIIGSLGHHAIMLGLP
jgi:hypothetical protein